jgi:uncharacterized protein YhbP (UPF0306 family)
MSVRATARAAGYSDHTLLSKVLNGHKPVTPYLAGRLDRALGADGEITAAANLAIAEAEAARHAGTRAEEVETTLRRDFITLGGVSGLAVAGQLWGTLESEPDNIHMALDRGTTSAERASYLEGAADDLGVQVVKAQPLSVLQPALGSLQSIRRLLEVRQPTRQQVRLVTASAKLCIVVGEIMFNVGQFQKAHEWYLTAEHAAHDVGDQYLADIALAGQAYLPTYSEDPNGVLALLEPRLASNPSPSPAIAWLWGSTARAHAALNHPELFQLAIASAEDALDRSSPDAVRPGIFSFLLEKLAFYEATGAVRLNDTNRALAAANRALALYDLSETTEPTLAKLERASALAKGGEVPEACSIAAAALLDPTTYHGVTIRTYAAKFDSLVREIDLPETRQWREVHREIHGREATAIEKGWNLFQMDTARTTLEEYVRSGMLMQVATISDTGSPAICHVWYRAHFRPDRLYFISRHDREHSANIRNNQQVAGGIVSIPLSGLGQTVRGVTFKGQARELGTDAGAELERFLERWPNARSLISIKRIAENDTPSRLYEIGIDQWVLFDEQTFPDSPRCLIRGEHA